MSGLLVNKDLFVSEKVVDKDLFVSETVVDKRSALNVVGGRPKGFCEQQGRGRHLARGEAGEVQEVSPQDTLFSERLLLQQGGRPPRIYL